LIGLSVGEDTRTTSIESEVAVEAGENEKWCDSCEIGLAVNFKTGGTGLSSECHSSFDPATTLLVTGTSAASSSTVSLLQSHDINILALCRAAPIAART
jgi:hypothetical protein